MSLLAESLRGQSQGLCNWCRAAAAKSGFKNKAESCRASFLELSGRSVTPKVTPRFISCVVCEKSDLEVLSPVAGACPEILQPPGTASSLAARRLGAFEAAHFALTRRKPRRESLPWF